MLVRIDSQLRITDYTKAEKGKIIENNTWLNPAYTQARKMRRKTWNIDKYLFTYSLDGNEIVVPRGYLSKLPDCKVIDNTTVAAAHIPTLNGFIPKGYQEQAISETITHDQGILQSGTGSGKTLMGLAIAHEKQQRTLILTHSKNLMYQWQNEIKKFMGIDAGLIGDGKVIQGDITIAMLQTLDRNPELVQQLCGNYGTALIEECHHIPSNTFSKVINQLACKYRYGLTATPHRRDGLHDLINLHIGDVVAVVADNDVAAENGSVPITVKKIYSKRYYQVDNWNGYVNQLTADASRNAQIVSAGEKASEKMPTLILTDRVQHAETLSQMSKKKHLLIHGKLKAKERRERMAQIAQYDLVIGTTGLLGEGLDVSGWTALILSTPISSRVKLLQVIGRVMRPALGKTRGFVADFVDSCHFSRSSYKKRLEIYAEKGYKLVA